MVLMTQTSGLLLPPRPFLAAQLLTMRHSVMVTQLTRDKESF